MINSNDNAKVTDNAPKLSNSRPLVLLEEEFAATLKNDLRNVIRRGDLLIEIKATLGRGKWLPWLAERFALSESTAQNYINAARFAEKYPTVRELKMGPGVLYWLMAREDELVGDKLNTIFALAENRWIGIEEASRAVISAGLPDRDTRVDAEPNGRQPRVAKSGTPAGAEKPGHDSSEGNAPDDPNVSADHCEDAPSIVPETHEETNAAPNLVCVPEGIAARLDGFDTAMRLILKFAAMPTAKLVGASYAPATSAGDIEMVGNFLGNLAQAIKKRALDKAA